MAQAIQVSIIVPTLGEAENLPILVPRIAAAMVGQSYEILVVDDNSPDRTPAVCAQLARLNPLRLLLRTEPRGGLSGAVLHGMAAAHGDVLVVMDADLQHPPERLPALIEPVEAGLADLAIGSRYIRGGTTHDGWGLHRLLNSRVATLLARPLVGPVRDPMSGFFAVSRAAYQSVQDDASPIGYKIGLEIMCRGMLRRIVEVPIDFVARERGDSKLTLREQGNYLIHLLGLYRFVLDRLPRAVVVLGVLLVMALVLRAVALASVVLIPEEAYYWMYAQHPSLSYYDHPPMVAWIIGLGTFVFGHSELGVRIVGNLLMLASSGVMYAFGAMWFGRKAGLIAAAALQVLPFYFGLGFIATMDSPLVFFWLLCMLGVTVALRRQNPAGWYLAGLALGAAMLSKYTGVFLGLGGVLAVIGHRPWRHHLRTVHPYVASAVALLMFSPVVLWNARHDWVSFRFQFVDRFADHAMGFDTVLAFIAFQLVVLTPFVGAALIVLAARVLRSRRRALTARWWFMLSFSAPLFGVIAYKSLRSEVHINWTAPMYLSLFPGMAYLVLAHWRRLRLRGRGFDWVPGMQWTAGVCLGINVCLVVFLMVLQPRLLWWKAFGPWPELAAAVEIREDLVEHQSGDEPLIIADGKYRLASVLAFYRTPLESDEAASDFTTSQWILGQNGLGYAYWMQREAWAGRTCLYVTDDRQISNDLRDWFDAVEVVGGVPAGFHLLVGRGYRQRLAHAGSAADAVGRIPLGPITPATLGLPAGRGAISAGAVAR